MFFACRRTSGETSPAPFFVLSTLYHTAPSAVKNLIRPLPFDVPETEDKRSDLRRDMSLWRSEVGWWVQELVQDSVASIIKQPTSTASQVFARSKEQVEAVNKRAAPTPTQV